MGFSPVQGCALSLVELFQQFVSRDEKPLQRLLRAPGSFHRAEALVITHMFREGISVALF